MFTVHSQAMRNLLKGFLFFLVIAPTSTYGQTTLFCIGDLHFQTSELARRAMLSCTIRATFDVRNFKAHNIRLALQDTSFGTLLFPETESNIQRLIFLRDTVHASLTLRYSYVSPGSVSTDYAVAHSDSALELVFRAPEGFYFSHEGPQRVVAQNRDTITYGTIVVGSPTNSQKSKITVERRFSARGDTSIIVENNHPELTKEILKAAKGYDLDWFIYLQHPDMEPSKAREQYPEASKRRYLLKFHILRRIPSCSRETVL